MTTINTQLNAVDTKAITESIAINKKDIEDIKAITDKIKIDDLTKLDKVKILHGDKFKGIPYVIRLELNLDYIVNSDKGVGGIFLFETITGIYRITVFSEHQSNIEATVRDDNSKIITNNRGVNTVTVIYNPPDVNSSTFQFEFTTVDPTVVRTKFSYILEYLSAI